MMAGKPKDPNRVQTGGGWGGKRPGAGRKPATVATNKQIKAMLTAARKRAKAEGKTIDDILLDIIYNDIAYEIALKSGKKTIQCEVPPKEKIAAIKLFKEFTIPKKTEVARSKPTAGGPVIGLPPSDPDPALQVLKGGKK